MSLLVGPLRSRLTATALARLSRCGWSNGGSDNGHNSRTSWRRSVGVLAAGAVMVTSLQAGGGNELDAGIPGVTGLIYSTPESRADSPDDLIVKREPGIISVQKSAQARSSLHSWSAPTGTPSAGETLSSRFTCNSPLRTLPSGEPASVPYLVIGGGVAGIAAARAIRASDPQSRVLIISEESTPPYLKPPLSKELWRRSEKRLKNMMDPSGDMKQHSWLYFEPSSFFMSPQQLAVNAPFGGVGLWSGKRVRRLDVEHKSVELTSGEKIQFGACLLAVGGHPRRLDVLEKSSPAVRTRVRYFRTLEDFRRLSSEARRCRKVVVIGGGFLGTELAVSLAEASKRRTVETSVTHVFKESGCLAHVLPDCLARHTSDVVASHGVQVLAGQKVVKATGSEDPGDISVRLQLESGQQVDADLVVVAIGLDANTELSSSSGLEVDDRLGGFLVNAELRARDNVFVAGDASSYYDPLLGRRRVEHINHAEESGRVAGTNMAGGREVYSHQSSFWSTLGPRLTWDAVGRIDSKLDTYGFFARPEAALDHEDYSYPGVVFYLDKGRLVGVLIWNLSDEIYQDQKKFAPSRLNYARSLLADRLTFGEEPREELAELARQFDLYGTVDEDYQELARYIAARQALEKETEKEEEDN